MRLIITALRVTYVTASQLNIPFNQTNHAY